MANNMNVAHALSATILFGIIAVGLLYLGGHATRVLVLVALFLAALSQFIAQSDGHFWKGVAYALSWAAISVAAAAVFGFSVTL